MTLPYHDQHRALVLAMRKRNQSCAFLDEAHGPTQLTQALELIPIASRSFLWYEVKSLVDAQLLACVRQARHKETEHD